MLNITYVQLNLTVLISFELQQNLPDRQLCKYVSVFKIRSTLPHIHTYILLYIPLDSRVDILYIVIYYIEILYVPRNLSSLIENILQNFINTLPIIFSSQHLVIFS